MGKSETLCVLAAPCRGEHLPGTLPYFLPKYGLIRESFLLIPWGQELLLLPGFLGKPTP